MLPWSSQPLRDMSCSEADFLRILTAGLGLAVSRVPGGVQVDATEATLFYALTPEARARYVNA